MTSSITQPSEHVSLPLVPIPRVLEAGEPEGFSLEQILAILRRRLRTIATVMVIGTALAVSTSYLIGPKYNATSSVSVDINEPRFADVTVDDQRGAMSKEGIATKVALIMSRPLVTQVMNELHLYDDPLFNPDPLYVKLLQPIKMLASLLPADLLVTTHLETATDTAFETPRPSQPELAREAAFERFLVPLLVNQATGSLLGSQGGESEVINISYSLRDPEKAAAIANALADVYIQWDIEHRQQTARQAAAWLEPRLRDLQAVVQQAEKAAADFSIKHGLSIPSSTAQGTANGTAAGTLNDQRLTDLRNELVTLQAEQIQKKTQLDRVRAARNSPDVVSVVLASPIITQLRAQEVGLQSQQAQLAQSFGKRHPRILEMEAQINGIDQKIRLEVGHAIVSMQDDLSMMASRETLISNEIQTLQLEHMQDRQAEIELRELERRAKVYRDQYETYLARYEDARQEAEVVRSKARVISRAVPPAIPTTPGPLIVGFVGFTASLTLGSLLAFLLERINQRVRNISQLESVLGVPVLGFLPLTSARQAVKYPGSYIAEQPFTFYAEAAQSIVTQLRTPVETSVPSTVMVASALPGEGKTTLAVSLAAAAIRIGLRTVIIDLDLRKPSISSRIGPEKIQAGLVDFLAGGMVQADIIHRDRKSGIHFIPAGRASDNPAKLLQSRALEALIEALRREYDLIVMDSSPLLAVSAASMAGRFADRIILTARWNSTEIAAAAEALNRLSRLKLDQVTFVMTMVNIKKYRLYSQGDAAVYYRRYRKYYLE